MRDLARLAIAAFGRQGEGSGVIGVDVQRIRRALGLRAEPAARPAARTTRAATACPRDEIRRFEALLRRELERAQIERTEQLPPARPAQRARPRAAERAAAGPRRRAPRRRPAQAPPEDPGPGAAAGASATRTSTCAGRCARRCETGGVPGRPQVQAGPPAAAGDLRALRRLDVGHERVACSSCRSCTRCTTRFARCARSSSSSASARSPTSSQRERDFKAVSEAIGRDAGVADISGYTDYGRVWTRVPRAGRGRPAPARDGHRARRRAHQRPRPARRHLRADRRARPAARSGSTPSRACTGTTATR